MSEPEQLEIQEKLYHSKNSHNAKRNHKCELCTKTFQGEYKLKKHIYEVHEGNKDYECNSCGKLFSQGGSLKRHIGPNLLL